MDQDNLMSEFTTPHPLNTAVLFLVFNRLDVTKQVFESIRAAKPPRLYIAADGARETREGEEQKVKDVRKYITSNIDWKCKVKTLFREENLGCTIAVSGAIDWFFENEEMGIILEDDCIPDISFFAYCNFLLNKYKDDKRIMGISGTNFFPEKKDEIFFTAGGGSIWGWATWKRSWDLYNHDIMNDDIMKLNYQGVFKFKKGLYKMIYKSYSGMYDKSNNWVWDMRWGYAVLLNHGLFINPKKNLITNIGIHGTHGDVKEVINKDKQAFNIDNLILPKYFIPNYEYEVKVLNKYMPISFGPKRMLAHIIGSIGLYDFFIKFYKKYKK
jgi:hypothetical protein